MFACVSCVCGMYVPRLIFIYVQAPGFLPGNLPRH